MNPPKKIDKDGWMESSEYHWSVRISELIRKSHPELEPVMGESKGQALRKVAQVIEDLQKQVSKQ